jgi:hypothetical protein
VFAGLVVLSAMVVTMVPSVPAGAAPLNRPADPVVLTGANLPTLSTAKPAQLLGFAATGTGWRQIPIQVDERAVLNFGRVYHGSANNVNILGYTSKKTWAGADPVKTFDANDELAFMARDAGIQAPSATAPAGTKAGSGVQVRIVDPLAPANVGYVYLFRKGNGSTLTSGAGAAYVKYAFKLNAGNYKKKYKFTAGPNPENSLVTAPYYTHHFSDRWLSDSIQVTAPAANQADILDRHKVLFAPGNCGRSEDTFDAGEGAFITNTAGPVRVIRSYIGANSGPNTQREHVFYEQREDIRTNLRVHQIPAIMDFFDYSAAASGMTYRNNLNPAGVVIDGVPDAPVAGAPTWEQVTGAQGSLTFVNQLTVTGFTPSGMTSYYLDDSTPPVTQCTGDAAAYGSSGSYFNGTIPCTDPGTGCTATVSATRSIYFGSPGATAATATTLSDQVAQPLTSTATAWP